MSEGTPTPEATPQADYQAPASQAELDRIIEARLSRERAKFPDYEKFKADSEKLSELEAASKTELEKEKDLRAAAEKELTELKASQQIEAWKQEVGEAEGVKASLLSGSTKEEIEKHAKAIKEAYGNPAAPFVRSDGKTPPSKTKTAVEAFDEVFEKLG